MSLLLKQLDTLRELINIGYGRAAGALCDLVGERVTLDVPNIEIAFLNELTPALARIFKNEVWSVHQVFSGSLKGHALLMVDAQAAEGLTQAVLMKDKIPPGQKMVLMQEALSEIGNIVLQGAMGICGEVLKVQLKFSVPGLRVENIHTMLKSASVDDDAVQYALLIRTRFSIQAKKVTGYLVVILGVTSFNRLMDALDEWEKR
ncbi:MAG TPA: chemotaxis protein CheC [Verrucomicrobiae bacterium]|nr:chemotaxis protein CheC [Verrucomicrobiae bacterium]